MRPHLLVVWLSDHQGLVPFALERGPGLELELETTMASLVIRG